MPITPERLALRKGYIGSSDMAAVMNVSPWATSYDVWLDKTGRLEPQPGNQAMSLGTALEDGLISLAQQKLGPMKSDVFAACKDFPIMGSSADAIIIETGEPVEVKTAGLTHYDFSDEWGEPGTDEVPFQYVAQCFMHMICHEAKRCHLVALVGGRGLLYYVIEYDPELAEAIKITAKRFWEDHVLADIAPENSIPSVGTIKRVRREPETVQEVDPALIENWLSSKEEEKAAKKEKERSQCALLAALGDAEGSIPNEAGQITYFKTKKGFRTINHKKPRKGAK